MTDWVSDMLIRLDEGINDDASLCNVSLIALPTEHLFLHGWVACPAIDPKHTEAFCKAIFTVLKYTHAFPLIGRVVTDPCVHNVYVREIRRLAYVAMSEQLFPGHYISAFAGAVFVGTDSGNWWTLPEDTTVEDDIDIYNAWVNLSHLYFDLAWVNYDGDYDDDEEDYSAKKIAIPPRSMMVVSGDVQFVPVMERTADTSHVRVCISFAVSANPFEVEVDKQDANATMKKLREMPYCYDEMTFDTALLGQQALFMDYSDQELQMYRGMRL